ncbi:mechanosensitive ion channel family protein [Skermanella stibiiresistens]|uniref:mechanosensitive ion channel family protein n=1 Tax=Skermanella stibiiresistens TaxID=913326 RepID=UPI0018DE2F52|nr:mechanosensitive ion channel family protein [Skermanella stibiiresistens]
MSAGNRPIRLPAVALAVLVALLLHLPPPVLAQPAAGTPGKQVDILLRAFPGGLTPEQADAVLGVMDETELREAMRPRLLTGSEGEGTRRPTEETAPAAALAHRIDAVAGAFPRVPAAIADAFARPNGQDAAVGPAKLVLSILFLFAVGAAALLTVRRLLPDPDPPDPDPPDPDPNDGDKVLYRAARSLGIHSVWGTAFLVGLLLGYAILRPSHPAAPAILVAVLEATITVFLADLVIRFLCAPNHPKRRLLPVGDQGARSIYQTAVVAASLTAATLGLADLLGALGTAYDPLIALVLPISTAPFLYLLYRLWSRRPAMAHALNSHLGLGTRETPTLILGLSLVTLYLAGLWLSAAAATLRQEPGTGLRLLLSLFLSAAVPLLALMLRLPIIRFYRTSDEQADSKAALRLMRAVWAALMVLTVVATAFIWGFDPSTHIGLGGIVLRLLFDIGIILLLGYVGWELLARSFDRMMATNKVGDARTAQRMATLLPLVRKFLQVVLIAIVAMIVLSSMGIAIGPLLAGAGVVGIAVGLGAQSTIADVLSGVFFLLEDAFRIGDYVEVGNLRGTVEGISLRSLKLRHHRGAVHTLPFGQIKALTNLTRDWSLMRLEFRVAPDTDLDLVKRVIKGIGRELEADPEMGPSFIEPLKSQGVRRVEDDAVIIGVKYVTKPGEQFVIRREAYQRILKAFKANGIDLVGRGVVVRVDDAQAGERAVGFAAAQAIRSVLE